jgi:DNA recombination protein RmuC
VTAKDIALLLAGAGIGLLAAGLVAWLLARARIALAHAAGRASREAEVLALAARAEGAELLERQAVELRAELAALRAAAAAEEAALREAGLAEAARLRAEHGAEMAQLRKAHAGELAQLRDAQAAQLRQEREAQALAAQREREAAAEALQRELAARRGAETRAAEAVARLEEQQQAAAARYRDLEAAREQLKLEFQQLSAAILDDRSKRFDEAQQQQLGQLLTPLRDQLGEFRRAVHEAYEKENNARVALQTRIDDLVRLNQTLGAEAQSLSRALNADNRAQGYWGELKLERLLESAGLEKGAQYLTQESFLDGEGERYRPDAVLRLPENRDIVIDAKMVLVDYQRACETAAEDEREQHLARHAGALRTHVKQLGEKDYSRLDGVNTPDLVLLFVPVEGAFLEALRRDPSLYDFAFARKIILVGPSNLLASLRLVAQIWRTEAQNRNAKAIADRAAALYDKFVGFAEDLAKVGEHLDRAQGAHRAALGKLSQGKGNLVRQAEMLRELGVAPAKRLAANLLDASAGDGDSEAVHQSSD